MNLSTHNKHGLLGPANAGPSRRRYTSIEVWRVENNTHGNLNELK
jgi:hypothetical protein